MLPLLEEVAMVEFERLPTWSPRDRLPGSYGGP